jgi:hypothetical protein
VPHPDRRRTPCVRSVAARPARWLARHRLASPRSPAQECYIGDYILYVLCVWDFYIPYILYAYYYFCIS